MLVLNSLAQANFSCKGILNKQDLPRIDSPQISTLEYNRLNLYLYNLYFWQNGLMGSLL